MNTKQLTEAVKALQEANKPKIGDWRIVKRGFMYYDVERYENAVFGQWWSFSKKTLWTLNGARKYILSRIGTDNSKERENVMAYFTK